MRRAGDRPSSKPAVWFFPSDYVGVWRRLAVELVDSVVIVVGLVLVTATVVLLDPGEDLSDTTLAVAISCWAVLIYGYFVVLKRSRLTTVGYRLARVRIVDACGRPPRLGALTLRLSFGLLGPFNIVLDMLWIPFDRHKQTLRDKLAHTYVVKANAEPAGPARIVVRTYSIVGMSFVFQDVEPVSVGSAAGIDNRRSPTTGTRLTSREEC
jgi:uncharacterized RDD family membrane protein YckC